MEELLVFSDNKTSEKVGMYYTAWLFIIRCILVKYGHKTAEEADGILKKHYYKKPANFDDVISSETTYSNKITIRKSIFPNFLLRSLKTLFFFGCYMQKI